MDFAYFLKETETDASHNKTPYVLHFKIDKTDASLCLKTDDTDKKIMIDFSEIKKEMFDFSFISFSE